MANNLELNMDVTALCFSPIYSGECFIASFNSDRRHAKCDGSLLSRITVVLAPWCPHCVPLSLERTQAMAKSLGVPLRVLDIDDPEQEAAADALVMQYGDYAEDYLIPQVFTEDDRGRVEHIFTGFSEGVQVTKARWNDFEASKFYRQTLRN